jgi:hypothetical protein
VTNKTFYVGDCTIGHVDDHAPPAHHLNYDPKKHWAEEQYSLTLSAIKRDATSLVRMVLKPPLRNPFRPIIRPSNGSGLHPGKPTPNNADGLVILHLFKKCLLIHMGMQPPSLHCLLGRREDKTRLKVQSAVFNRLYPVLNLDRILAPLRFGRCCPGTQLARPGTSSSMNTYLNFSRNWSKFIRVSSSWFATSLVHCNLFETNAWRWLCEKRASISHN